MLLHCNEMGVGCYRGCVTSWEKWEPNEINNLEVFCFKCYRDFIALLHRNRGLGVMRVKKASILYIACETTKNQDYRIAMFLTVWILKRLLHCNNYILYIYIYIFSFLFETLSITFWWAFAIFGVTEHLLQICDFCYIVTSQSFKLKSFPLPS